MAGNAISQSLERVAELCADPAPLVYARLFEAHPGMAALFVRDVSGAVRGHMLATAIDNLLDLTDDSPIAATLIQAERVNHENLGVPPDVFPAFFSAMADAFRDVLGAEWTPEIDAAWATLLERLAAAAAAA